MQRDFFDENFEWFLKRNADSFKMTASDQVWSSISRELKKRRRRMNWTMAASFMILSGLGYILVTNSVKELPQQAARQQQQVPSDVSTPLPELKNSTASTPPTADNNNTILMPALNSRPIAAISAEKSADVQEVTTDRTYITPEDNISTPLEEARVTRIEPLLVSKVAPIDADDLVSALDQQGESITMVSAPAAESIAANNMDQLNQALNELKNDDAATVVASVKPRRKKIDWQLALTPNISYRKLGENRSYLRAPAGTLLQPAGFTPLYSVNSAVTHKPDLGFEVGVTAKYRLTKSVRVTGGVQFNVNRYDIKAFDAPYAVATIRLNGGSGPSAVNAVSNYSNYNGYNTNWLNNLYFQASAPIGIELRLQGDDKVQFGLATTVQPSYVLGDRAYLITSDYKSYVRVPWLVRRWNANTNFHTFVSYYTGKMKWQVGPQVRYQLLSSFVTEYPVKENLFDFGMRIGISLGKD